MNIFVRKTKSYGKLFALPGHGTGDVGLALRFLKVLSGQQEDMRDITFIDKTLPSHAIIAAAELSRHRSGERVLMNDFYAGVTEKQKYL
jgi:hypothetical protein